MSMKLDENSFNLKEEAEIKGGGVFTNGLPKGFSEAKSQEVEAINKQFIATGTQINDKAQLIKISKKSWSQKIPQFTKFDQLFGEEKTGKSLHFLKASFFKTDDNTIYTYSEHRTPMELVEDFSEYYGIELNKQRNTYLKNIEKYSEGMTATNNFMKLINILYAFCKQTDKQTDKQTENNDFSTTTIAYSKITREYIFNMHTKIRNKLNDDDKEIFLLLNNDDNLLEVLGAWNGTDALENYDISKILLDNNKINPYEIFKLIKEMQELLDNNIIKKIFTDFDKKDNIIKSMLQKAIQNSFYTEKNLKDTNYRDFFKKIEITIMGEKDYITLYEYISEKFKASVDRLEPDKKISAEKDILDLLIKKIDKLKDNINQLNKNITSDHESTDFKDIIANAEKTINEIIYNEADEKIKELYNRSYYIDINNYQNTNEKIVKLYNELKENIKKGSDDKVKKFETDINYLETLINGNKDKFFKLDSIYHKEVDIINKANEKIKGVGNNEGIFKLFSKPSKQVYEGLLTGVPQNQSYILTSEIPDYIALLKSNITIEETKEEDARKKKAQVKQQQQKEQEWKAQDFKAMWQQSGGLGTGSTRASGGGNNTKELRKKLNTMSIKQLKILSDKNHIKYGNKNTIKSLINNYMKHI